MASRPTAARTERASMSFTTFLNFFWIAIGLAVGFLAFTGLAIHFSQIGNETLSPIFGWVGFAFFIADLLWIGWDYD